MKHGLLFSVLFASAMLHAPLAIASEAGVVPTQQRVYTYAIELAGDGSVTRLAPHGFEADAISRDLDTQIGNWIFAAAEAGGVPASTTTFLRVVVAANNDGGFDVLSATTGPAAQTLAQPDYPVRDQLAGMEGTVVLKLAVDADGRVSAADVHDVVGSVSRAMANAAKSSAMGWTFSPETVAGQPVPSTVLWPVCYLGAASSASSCDWRGPDAQRFSSKTVLTLNPAARLVSPLAFEGR